jgi:hypothetical protein
MMTPGTSHALIALALQVMLAVPLMFLLRDAPTAFGVGWAFASGFYVGRERRQSEEWYGTNRLFPWEWRPRAFRDAAWPTLACGGLWGLVAAYTV